MPRNLAAHLTLTTPLLSAATAWLREARPANTELRDHDGPPFPATFGIAILSLTLARSRE
jgi:hypothetical protein